MNTESLAPDSASAQRDISSACFVIPTRQSDEASNRRTRRGKGRVAPLRRLGRSRQSVYSDTGSPTIVAVSQTSREKREDEKKGPSISYVSVMCRNRWAARGAAVQFTRSRVACMHRCGASANPVQLSLRNARSPVQQRMVNNGPPAAGSTRPRQVTSHTAASITHRWRGEMRDSLSSLSVNARSRNREPACSSLGYRARADFFPS